ncbi:hypothetical protein [Azospirillum melinis]
MKRGFPALRSGPPGGGHQQEGRIPKFVGIIGQHAPRRFFRAERAGERKTAAGGTEALPPAGELSYRSKRNAYPPSSTGAVPMDIAIMVLAVAFFFWQTITD